MNVPYNIYYIYCICLPYHCLQNPDQHTGVLDLPQIRIEIKHVHIWRERRGPATDIDGPLSWKHVLMTWPAHTGPDLAAVPLRNPAAILLIRIVRHHIELYLLQSTNWNSSLSLSSSSSWPGISPRIFLSLIYSWHSLAYLSLLGRFFATLLEMTFRSTLSTTKPFTTAIRALKLTDIVFRCACSVVLLFCCSAVSVVLFCRASRSAASLIFTHSLSLSSASRNTSPAILPNDRVLSTDGGSRVLEKLRSGGKACRLTENGLPNAGVPGEKQSTELQNTANTLQQTI